MNLWDFSLRFYGDAAVQQACLVIQDQYGADVTVVLYLLWRAAAGETFDAAGVAAIDAAVAPWRTQVVHPLRAIRRAMKATDLIGDPAAQEALRSKIKAVELEAERRELEALERLGALPATTDSRRSAARASLAAYAGLLRASLPDDLIAVFLERLDAIAA